AVSPRPVEEGGGSLEKGGGAGHIERLGKVAQATRDKQGSVGQQAGLRQGQKEGKGAEGARNEDLIQQDIEHVKQTREN
ncbi:hypothetical protein QM274_18355, partial [Acinetobacter baumannii]|uniref:hypothetical protein n=1 Tax=Acinetobacter baumannii TaxID=470 RepID=UPI0024B7224F